MRLCSLFGPVRSLAIALMDDKQSGLSFPGKKAVLLSELEYDALKDALSLSKETSARFCSGEYVVPYKEDKTDVFEEQFITEGLYQDLLHPMVFDMGQGKKGYVAFVDKDYAKPLQLFSQMYGQLFGFMFAAKQGGGNL